MSDVLWRRLRYMLTPQFDIYESIARNTDDLAVTLDVGFGTGFGTLQLVGDATLIGIEIDPNAVEFAQRCLPGIDYRLGNICDAETVAQLRAERFDVVTMIEVLEHIPDWRTALGHVCRLLCAGGKLYISARNRNADLRRNDLHEREWTAAEFRGALAGYFTSVKLYDYTLTAELGDDTHVTPLVAVCVK